MKKKILKISALVAAVALIVGVCLFANSLVGNPISKALAKHTAEEYIRDTYADQNLTLDSISYSFKDWYYHAHITSPDMDGDFTLLINQLGTLRHDTYSDRVPGGWNTADRIRGDYRALVESVINSKSFPYDAYIGYGDIEFISREYKNASTVPDYALVTEDLTVGGFYNAGEMGARAGKLTLYIDLDGTTGQSATAERLAEMLLNIRKTFDEAGVGFYAIDCVLEDPYAEAGAGETERIEVMDFLYADIYEEGLAERVKASDEAARSYYAVEDAEKMMEGFEGME